MKVGDLVMLSSYGAGRNINAEYLGTFGIVVAIGYGQHDEKHYVNTQWTFKDGSMRECMFLRNELRKARKGIG